MRYLTVDSTMPAPYGKFIWSDEIGNATPFDSLGEANAQKNQVPDATGVVEFSGKWFVTLDSK